MSPSPLPAPEPLEMLCAGSTGRLHRARSAEGELVGLFVLEPELTADEEDTERLLAEVEALAGAERPGLPRILGTTRTGDGALGLVLAEASAGTLADRIARGPLSPTDALGAALAVAEGLRAAHALGWYGHESNIEHVLLTDSGRPLLLEPWAPRLLGARLEDGEPATERDDLRALGALLEALARASAEQAGGADLSGLAAGLAREDGTLDEAIAELRRRRAASNVIPVESLAPPWWTRPSIVLPVLVLLGAGLAWWTHRNTSRTWARNHALPEIEALASRLLWDSAGPEGWRAYDLAVEARQTLGSDPRLRHAWNQVIRHRPIESVPDGAEVFGAPFAAPDGPWRRIGTTPLPHASLPRGLSLVRLEKEGYEPVVDVTLDLADPADTPPYRLVPTGTAPVGTVRARGEASDVYLPGFDGVEPVPLGAFWVDRCEVTNAAFKRFVDLGGYRTRDHWKHPFREGRGTRGTVELSWEEAMARFVDSTGQPGPSTWADGAPVDGAWDQPVAGVSWYEAAAYAEFLGMRLPTLFHWNLVAAPRASSGIVTNSNLEGEGLAPVGTFAATHRFGTKDLAGNVREWCRNVVDPGALRLILGGAWNESAYAFLDPNALDPFDRSATNGFRCVQPIDPEPPEVGRTFDLPTRDFLSEAPVPDDVFARYLAQFDYERTPLEAEIVERHEAYDVTYERIELDAAYADERLAAYLFLPRQGTPPYQTVVVFPGSELVGLEVDEPFADGARKFYYDFLVKSGRAVLLPVYKGLLDRSSGLVRTVPQPTTQYRDHVIAWAQDLSRAIDYVETRDDLDESRLAYFGFNWGGAMGAMMPAIEKRFDASVLYVAGLKHVKPLPEVDPIHYVSRVVTPTLMINGEYDYLYPVETSQRPMFELLGCAPENKKWITFEGSHAVPREEFVKETLDWLDRFLGPVAL